MHVFGELISADLGQTKIPIQKITLPGEAFPLQLCDNRCVTHLTQIPAVIASKPVQTFVRRRCVCVRVITIRASCIKMVHCISLDLISFSLIFYLFWSQYMELIC